MKLWFVAPYFGPPPEYAQLWLNSCATNVGFNWLVLADKSWDQLAIPANVRVEQSTLPAIRRILSDALAVAIPLTTPYKLCDFRPVFWCILDRYSIQYDFWGHCDFDMIFGDLAVFITQDCLDKYDKLFSVGHLSLYRNDPILKLAFALPGAAVTFSKVVSTPDNLGFDEHFGINMIWQANRLSILYGEDRIADVLPNFEPFVLNHLSANRSGASFTWENGKLRMHYRNILGLRRTREFMYIHFQKRKLALRDRSVALGREFCISASGFYSVTEDAHVVNGKIGLRLSDLLPIFRLCLRKLRRRHSRARMA